MGVIYTHQTFGRSPKAIGVFAAEHIATALITESKICGPIQLYPEPGSDHFLVDLPVEAIVAHLATGIQLAAGTEEIEAVGVGFPGIIRDGIVEDSSNLPQTKGSNLKIALSQELQKMGRTVPVTILNDADAMAAGIAATVGRLDRMVRVWMLGDGIGFGRYPRAEGTWEGGHLVVTLDPKENYCGCGGRGHLEGVMGRRAIRLRFWDLEPEEVFAKAAAGNAHFEEFVKYWHCALAAGCAASIHLDGPGKFFVTGRNLRFLDLGLLSQYVDEMVTMSPLLGSSFQIMEAGDEIGILGAAVDAQIGIPEIITGSAR
jgi:predicted NBD/HSP70 family sugar kinase